MAIEPLKRKTVSRYIGKELKVAKRLMAIEPLKRQEGPQEGHGHGRCKEAYGD